MIHTLIQWDRAIFFYINQELSNPFLDWLMPIIREKYTWVPLYLLLIVYLPLKFRIKGFYAILVLLACIAFSDLVSAHVVKPFFHRLRPCINPLLNKTIHRRISCGSGFSFVSSHASNHFAIAVFLIFLLKPYLRWIALPAIVWAGAISLAQVYEGLHYPSDVFTGAIIGSLVAWLFYYLASRFHLLPEKLNVLDTEGKQEGQNTEGGNTDPEKNIEKSGT